MPLRKYQGLPFAPSDLPPGIRLDYVRNEDDSTDFLFWYRDRWEVWVGHAIGSAPGDGYRYDAVYRGSEPWLDGAVIEEARSVTFPTVAEALKAVIPRIEEAVRIGVAELNRKNGEVPDGQPDDHDRGGILPPPDFHGPHTAPVRGWRSLFKPGRWRSPR